MEVAGDNLVEAPNPIHGDILESIFNHVPLIDLVPATYVSKSWKFAVSTSLQEGAGGRRRRSKYRIKPWLLIYSQTTRFPHSTTAHAYDPRSHVWVQIHQPSIKFVSALRSSHSTLLYMLSPSIFSFSYDPLHLTWHHIKAPLMWRTDPIVAMVGKRIVIAGGTCHFEDDPLACEMYDLETSEWETCESMPAIFRESAAPTWLSVAVNSNKNKMYVVEKSTGVAYSFDPSIKAWHGPHHLRPHTITSICRYFIGFANNDRLILVGITGDDDIESVKLWEVDCESPEILRDIGEMPKQLVDKMKVRGDDGMGFDMSTWSSISVSLMDDFVYIYSSSDGGGSIIMCEIGGGDESSADNWSSVVSMNAGNDVDRYRLTNRIVLACSKVGLDDLDKAIMSKSRKFSTRDIM
ncbi:unnamed protein product [Dovyalis caffra]|uniref:F-box domain-containing protein n=1 Tax=Dovyalis caffra TaxID=77055 RepID=A0AAV1RG07_9ROSI|nr:unnamed protein product [Dovyalis caffra]